MPAVLEERSTTTSPLLLARNLAALQRCSRAAADLIHRTEPRADANFLLTQDTDALGEPVLTATIPGPAGPALLASRRRPLDEARRLAETVDLEKAGGVVVMGFGVGHHVAEIARRMQRTGVVFVFEPDAALLRAVFERIDHSGWIARANVVFLTDPDEAAAIHAAMRGAEGVLALGVKVVEHPASLSRLAAAGAARFRRHLADAVNAVKTAVVTTLVQSDVTFRNMLMNLGHYVTRPGIEDLRDAAAGRPAIVVAAGPSLRRNLDRLAGPAVHERFVIIAVQTVLKPMLARGIRPHFVTALDYHEISRRFYEGLTARDVEGITLVATPAANPAILDAFPGAIRVTSDRDPADPNPGVLDTLLTPALAGHRGQLPLAATVAHMGYYLARFLGCDPAILVGLDLGFTDGQYYAAGAAIHDVWASELNPFNSLERMEHERIVRNRRTLRRATDVLGRPVYTDDQMATYLAQFGRDFLADAARGLTIVDATEGGVAKPHTVVLPLAEAIARHAHAPPHALPATPPAASDAAARLRAARERLREVRQEVGRFGQVSAQTRALLGEMLDHHDDQPRVNRLITRVHEHRETVRALPVAPRLVERLNQVGVLKRVRADRDLELAAGLDPMQRQRRQIERDITNTRWLADAADHFGGMLDDAARVLGGAPKTTRDPAAPAAEPANGPPPAPVVAAVIPLLLRDGRCHAALSRPFLAGRTPLQLTLSRLLRCQRLGRVAILTDDPDAARRLIGSPPARLHIDILETPGLLERPAALRPARLWAASCWRGGLAHATIFDELLAPAPMAAALDRLGLDAAVLLGPDWALIDPALTDALVERHAEAPERHTLTFTQAAPGLAPCVIARSLVGELARAAEGSGPFATIGGLLGYIPIAPRPDPIAGPTCVHVPPVVRDVHARCIPDSPAARARLESALAPLGESMLDATAERIAEAIAAHEPAIPAPAELILELCTGRRTAGPRAATHRGAIDPPERAPMSADLAERLIAELAGARPDALLTLSGAGDPLLHPDLGRVVRAARAQGLGGVHVRTDLLADRAPIDALLDAEPDVISVDLMAESGPAYRALMGVDYFATARANLEHVLSRRSRVGGIPIPWIVPRITRCDQVYAEIEPFFDRWIMHAGAAAIDPLPEPARAERIEPLPAPARAAERFWSSRMFVLCDGRVPASEFDLAPERPVGDAAREGLLPVWRRLLAHRRKVAREHGPAHPDLRAGI